VSAEKPGRNAGDGFLHAEKSQFFFGEKAFSTAKDANTSGSLFTPVKKAEACDT
jgi:hypothetical protein